MVRVLICCTVITIATVNGNQPGTVDGESINLSKNCVNVLLLFTIATVNGYRPGTVDGESINLSKNHVYILLLLS